MVWVCEYCEDEFEARADRNQHMDDLGHWQCHECENLFDSKYQLKQHRDDKGH
jgi:hypothetical protein